MKTKEYIYQQANIGMPKQHRPQAVKASPWLKERIRAYRQQGMKVNAVAREIWKQYPQVHWNIILKIVREAQIGVKPGKITKNSSQAKQERKPIEKPKKQAETLALTIPLPKRVLFQQSQPAPKRIEQEPIKDERPARAAETSHSPASQQKIDYEEKIYHIIGASVIRKPGSKTLIQDPVQEQRVVDLCQELARKKKISALQERILRMFLGAKTERKTIDEIAQDERIQARQVFVALATGIFTLNHNIPLKGILVKHP